jgi:hypothetical protein
MRKHTFRLRRLATGALVICSASLIVGAAYGHGGGGDAA